MVPPVCFLRMPLALGFWLKSELERPLNFLS